MPITQVAVERLSLISDKSFESVLAALRQSANTTGLSLT